jgi:hypothetical protein
MNLPVDALGRSFAVHLTTPGDWIELDVNPSTRHRSIRKAVRRAVSRDPALEGNAVRVLRLLDGISQRAADSGAFYCATMIINEPPRDLVVASVLIQTYLGGPLPPVASASEVCAGLAAAISADLDWAGVEVGVVSLPRFGPAVRTCIGSPGAFVQYIAPLMLGSAQIMLTFSCPCPPNAATAIELFDAMASSFEMRLTTGGSRVG